MCTKVAARYEKKKWNGIINERKSECDEETNETKIYLMMKVGKTKKERWNWCMNKFSCLIRYNFAGLLVFLFV